MKRSKVKKAKFFEIKGFTLIEVLIVTVIIAVLAGLTIPRMLPRTESAFVAEAQQVLGNIKRAQLNYRSSMDVIEDPNSFLPVVCDAMGCGGANTDWTRLSLPSNIYSRSKFSYQCTTAGICTATRKTNINGKIILDIPNSQWSCDGTVYTLISAEKGCSSTQ